MTKEEMTLLGFEIVAYAGDARSKLLEALKAAEKGDFAQAESLVEEAGSCIAEAHKVSNNYASARSSRRRPPLQHYHDAWSRPSHDNDLIKRRDSPSD